MLSALYNFGSSSINIKNRLSVLQVFFISVLQSQVYLQSKDFRSRISAGFVLEGVISMSGVFIADASGVH